MRIQKVKNNNINQHIIQRPIKEPSFRGFDFSFFKKPEIFIPENADKIFDETATKIMEDEMKLKIEN